MFFKDFVRESFKMEGVKNFKNLDSAGRINKQINEIGTQESVFFRIWGVVNVIQSSNMLLR